MKTLSFLIIATLLINFAHGACVGYSNKCQEQIDELNDRVSVLENSKGNLQADEILIPAGTHLTWLSKHTITACANNTPDKVQQLTVGSIVRQTENVIRSSIIKTIPCGNHNLIVFHLNNKHAFQSIYMSREATKTLIAGVFENLVIKP